MSKLNNAILLLLLINLSSDYQLTFALENDSRGSFAAALYRTAAAHYVDHSIATIDSFDSSLKVQDIVYMLEEYMSLLSNFDQNISENVEKQLEILKERYSETPMEIRELQKNLYKFRESALKFLRAEQPYGLHLECEGASTTAGCVALVIHEAQRIQNKILEVKNRFSSIDF